MSTIIAGKCFFCNGSGRLDWRDALPPHSGAVTAEAHGVKMSDCPHCGGLGAIPRFASLTDIDISQL